MNEFISELKLMGTIALYLCSVCLLSLFTIWFLIWIFRIFFITLP
jgi:hypothetical protein